MSKKDCLLITTTDNRNLFTHKKHLSQLVEFSKILGAEISIVKAEDPEILSLEELAPAICDSSYRSRASFQLLERKLPGRMPLRQRFIKSATRIRQYIRESFLRGEVVELQEIIRKFNKMQLTSACFCNHLSRVRQELIDEGHTIEKTGGGKYKLIAKDCNSSSEHSANPAP